jgi:hypothetical protein
MEKRIAHVAELWQQGIICPAEAWNQILDATQGSSVVEALNSGEARTQRAVRELYFDRPGSLPVGRPDLRSWCEGGL